MFRGAAQLRDDRVDAVVLDPHEGGLAELARLRTHRGQHDHGPAAKFGTLLTVRRLVELGLLARPCGWARLVLSCEGHGPYHVPTATVCQWPGRRPSAAPSTV